MKKLVAILLILGLLCSFAACGTGETEQPEQPSFWVEEIIDVNRTLPPQEELQETLPPQTDPPQTLPPQTEPTLPPQTEPTLPPQTEPVLPPQTDPPAVQPGWTEPPVNQPSWTEPTQPPQTMPPEPVYTEPVYTEPETDPPAYPDPNGSYTTKEDVALYIHVYGHLPNNFITKSEARKLGWKSGSLERYAPGKCIGGDRFKNREGILPQGHTYYECDIDTMGSYDGRGAKRIVFSTDGQIYYTDDHYETFTLLYG